MLSLLPLVTHPLVYKMGACLEVRIKLLTTSAIYQSISIIMVSSAIVRLSQIILLVSLLLVKSSLLMPTPAPTTSSNSEDQPLNSNSNSAYTRRSTHDDDCSCDCSDSIDSCMSLGDAIRNYLTDRDPSSEYTFHFFSLQDLFFSGLIDGSGDLEETHLNLSTSSTSEKRNAQIRCDNVISRYNLMTKDGDCSWQYQCSQNKTFFPSYKVEAVYEHKPRYCEEVVIENPRFMRKRCESDNTLPHWCSCMCGSTVVGYKFRSDD